MGSMELGRPPFDAFRGRSVLITGHTGFKGSWLAIWLNQLGARVAGYALPPETTPNNFSVSRVRSALHAHYEADIRDAQQVARAVESAAPAVVFHLAAQPLVRKAYRTPRETFEVNTIGTASVLEAVRQWGQPCVVIVITSDKCYAQTTNPAGCVETDGLGGDEPYGASKAAAELVVASYRSTYFPPQRLERHGVQLATVRAGNVIGGGDWAEDRIVPDMIAALTSNQPVALRRPTAVRPWQHVLDALSGYLTLAQRMLNTEAPELSSAWNFGPDRGDATVRELAEMFLEEWGYGSWEVQGDVSQPPDAATLFLNAGRARRELGWKPVWNLEDSVRHTARWYRQFYQDGTAPCPENIATWQADWRRVSQGELEHV